MKTDTFKTRKFMGIDFTPRKKYRAEIERLERVNADIRRSFAEGEKDRNNLPKKCAEERNLRIAVELDLIKYTRKRGPTGGSSKKRRDDALLTS